MQVPRSAIEHLHSISLLNSIGHAQLAWTRRTVGCSSAAVAAADDNYDNIDDGDGDRTSLSIVTDIGEHIWCLT